jgi:hypothetical protein
MPPRLSRVCLVIAVAVLPRVAMAQNAYLSGVVSDPQGGVIDNAELTLTDQQTAAVLIAKSNNHGLYLFPSVRPSTYRLEAVAPGFAATTRAPLMLGVDQRLTLDLVLTIGTQAESVTVSGDRSLLGAADGSVSTLVDRTFAENLPVRGRSFLSLVRFAPGVALGSSDNQTFSVNGQRTISNSLTVDGVAGLAAASSFSSNGGAAGQLFASSIVGTINGGVTMDALREVRIQTSSFAAEFGRTPGGQISLVTRSGTNRFRGSAFEQFRNDAMMGNDWFANSRALPKGKLEEHLFGGTLGGPVIRERTFFFVSYEGLRLIEPKFISENVPSLEARERASRFQEVLRSYPLPTGPTQANLTAEFAATVSTRRSYDTLGIRGDHTLRSRFQVFGRFARTPTKSADGNPLTGRTTSDVAQNLTVGLTAAIGQGSVVEVRSNYGEATTRQNLLPSTTALRDFVPASAPARVTLNATGMALLQDIRSVADYRQRQGTVVASWAQLRGTHQIKAGIDFRWLRPSDAGDQAVQLSFPSLAQALTATTTNTTLLNGLPVSAIYRNLSSYAQDTWRATTNLSVTYGVRWDVNPAPAFGDGQGPVAVTRFNPITELTLGTEPGTPLWATNYTNFFPRLGFTYSLGKNAAWVLSGGGGVFGDLEGTAAATNVGQLISQAFQNVALPLTPFDVDANRVTPPRLPPYTSTVLVVDPDLKTPRTTQWNLTVERTMGSNQAASVAYVGARANNLLETRSILRPASAFNSFATTRQAAGKSKYDSVQFQYRRRASAGLHVLASYTLADARDTTSSLSSSDRAIGVLAPSDNDLRHSFNTGISWTLPNVRHSVLSWIINDWQMNLVASARSAYPFSITTPNISVPGEESFQIRASRAPGTPVEIDDPAAPGGIRYNPAAFVAAVPGQQGDTSRNEFRGFSARQVDVGLQRRLGIFGETRVKFRVDVFNLLNEPVFGPINGDLTNLTQFGRPTRTTSNSTATASALYREGGPRSVQLTARVEF